MKFIKVYDPGYVNKNNLHKAIKEHVKKHFDNRSTDDVSAVKKLIRHDIEILNKLHKRCHAIVAEDLGKWSGDNGLSLRVLGVDIKIYDCKGGISSERNPE